MDKSNEHSISLNKYISNTGICSRRAADELISAGRVTINKKIAQKGNRVFDGDVVHIDGKALQTKPKPIYLAFNKPVGIVCTTDPKEPKNIIDYINYPERLFPIGRLDKPSEGLIFLTNDGDIVNKILRSGNKHEKEYLVKVAQPINSKFLRKMRKGVPVLGTVTKECVVEQIDEYSFKIILTQGLNRQIRRMCTYLGYEVTFLKRVRIMNVHLGGLKTGFWRILNQKELSYIYRMVASSSKTEEASIDQNKKKNNKY